MAGASVEGTVELKVEGGSSGSPRSRASRRSATSRSNCTRASRVSHSAAALVPTGGSTAWGLRSEAVRAACSAPLPKKARLGSWVREQLGLLARLEATLFSGCSPKPTAARTSRGALPGTRWCSQRQVAAALLPTEG